MTLLPDRQDFSVWKGGTFRVEITVYTGADETTPVRNLTGYSAELIIRDAPEGTALQTLTNVNGGITLGGVTGILTLFMSAATTDAITWDVGYYDLTITASGGDTDPLLWGHFKVRGI